MKLILFDFDGTIADTFELVVRLSQDILNRHNIPVAPAEARTIGLQKTLIKSKFPKWKIPRAILEVKHQMGPKIESEVKLFEGMDAVIQGLSRRYELGIVSSNSAPNIQHFLEKYGRLNDFKYIYSDSSLFGKHVILKRLCKKYRIKTNDIIYIGDEDRDIIAAKRLGIRMIAVAWGYNCEALLEKEQPDYLVDSPGRILEILGV